MNLAEILDDKLSGIQLALFELIWPTFEWIESIYIKVDSNICLVHVQVAHLPDAEEQADCERLIGEIFDVVLAGMPLHLKVMQEKLAPSEFGYRKAMSGEIFKMIAKDIAPWRLDAGR